MGRRRNQDSKPRKAKRWPLLAQLLIGFFEACQPIAASDLRDPHVTIRNSQILLVRAKADLDALRAVRAKDSSKRLKRRQMLAILGAATTYIAVVGYALGYVYLKTYYDRVIPGMNIDYPYGPVLQSVVQRPFALVPLLIPAIYLLARAASPEYQRYRDEAGAVLRDIGWSRRLRRALTWQRWRHRGTPESEEVHAELAECARQGINALPDLYWKSAAAFLTAFVRPVVAVTAAAFAMVLLGLALVELGVWAFRWLALHSGLRVSVLSHASLWAIKVIFFFLCVLAAGMLASGVYIAFIAVESQYRGSSRLMRRRVWLAILTIGLLVLSVFLLGRATASIDRGFYRVNFQRVAIRTDRDLSVKPGALLSPGSAGLPTDTVTGYLVPVTTSPDYFVLVEKDPSSKLARQYPYGALRLPADSVQSVQHDFGPYDISPSAW